MQGKSDDLAEFDGSVVVERNDGDVSARCHDEQANCPALNLMHDLVTGESSVQEARAYDAKEFLDFRRGEPTPFMETFRFAPSDGSAADPDERVLSGEELERAKQEGQSTN